MLHERQAQGDFLVKEAQSKRGKGEGGQENPAPQDIYAMPGEDMRRVTNTQFEKRHWLSLVSAYLMRNPDVMARQVMMDRYMLIGTAILCLSLVVNAVEVSVPKMPQAVVSLPNDTHDTISLTTLDRPPNSTQIVINWAINAVCSSLSMSFADYDAKLERAREYFTPSGYEGFLEAVNDRLLPGIRDNGLIVTAAPFAAPLVSHYPVNRNDFIEIQIPIVASFSQGNLLRDKSSFWLVTVKIGATPSSEGYAGRKILSLLMDQASMPE